MNLEATSVGGGADPGIRLAVEEGVASLVLDRPDSRVNLLTTSAMDRFDGLLSRAEAGVREGDIKALVIRSAKPDNFIAGADINELARLEDPAEAERISRAGQEMFIRLSRLGVPTLAAINGACMGGGLELALHCDHRVASDNPKTRIGLPETRLGILPGLGGTVRLPRLIGLRNALDLILTGKQVRADEARSMGLVDEVIPADGFAAEVDKLIGSLAVGQNPLASQRPSVLQRLLEHSAPGRAAIRHFAMKGVMARTRGHYPAIPRALQVTIAGLGLSLERAYQEEAKAFGQLAATPVCKNLISVFQLREGARKRRPEGELRPIRRAAVVGAGIMGAGIAELFAYDAIPTKLIDIDEEQLEKGMARARELLEKGADRAGWTPEMLEERLEGLEGGTNYNGLEAADAVVEAVVERLDVKRQVFAELEEKVDPATLIASNTSALSISELQRSSRHPGRICGLHFFNPPHKMPLVEVVRGESTSADGLATGFDLAVRLGKTPVVVEDSPGFVVNRILAAYLTEAGHILEEGMPIRELDKTMTGFGMPMGPLRLLDEVGLDVIASVSETMEKGLGERFKPAALIARVLETGVTGKKGGEGFYVYENGKRKGVNEDIAQLISAVSGDSPPRTSVAEERMVFSMVNEAARTLDDGVVSAAEDIDVAMIMGAGFPPFRGGLLRYADSVGLGRILARLRELAAEHGPRFQPAPGLTQRDAFFSA